MNDSPIYSRRSIRKFKDTPISKEQIEAIIQAGSAAPSAKNRQPWKCIVLGNQCKEEFLIHMEKGIEREEHSQASLPKSRSGLPDA